MLTAAEAGKVLGLSTRTVYALAQAGKIACHRMGLGDGAVRFDPADIEAYKTACRSPATTRAILAWEALTITRLHSLRRVHDGLNNLAGNERWVI